MKTRTLAALCVTLVTLCLVLSRSLLAQSGSTERWVATWAAAPVGNPSQAPAASPPGRPLPPSFNNQTLRQVVHVSIGGSRVRVAFTNVFGTRPLVLGGAHVALREKGASIVSGSDRPLTFSGSPSASIPPGAILVSDPATLNVPPFADLVIDLFVPGDTAASPSPLTLHGGSRQVNYASASGNHGGSLELPGATPVNSWYFLSRVEVVAPEATAAVVTFGDSITDGYNSTPNANNRWPDHLARRLASAGRAMGVLNLGIDGNRVLADGLGVSALARFDRDVLAQPGVTHVFVLEGVNDLGLPALMMDGPRPTPAELIAGHRQLIARAHAKGLKIIAATLLPYEGTTIQGYFTAEGETVRQALNEWLRTSKEYDALVDFDAVMKDPDHPARMSPPYDSGDHLHPSDAGYKAMADAVDLALLGAASAR